MHWWTIHISVQSGWGNIDHRNPIKLNMGDDNLAFYFEIHIYLSSTLCPVDSVSTPSVNEGWWWILQFPQTLQEAVIELFLVKKLHLHLQIDGAYSRSI